MRLRLGLRLRLIVVEGVEGLKVEGVEVVRKSRIEN